MFDQKLLRKPSSTPLTVSILAALPLTMAMMTACGGTEDEPVSTAEDFARGTTGNGGPSGPHFNLNIIGVPQGKTAELTGGSGRRIFVPLSGSSKILLSAGEFQVLDGNGTDGEARFQLPVPDADADGVTSYSVFARALGTPGGGSKTTTCLTDQTTGELYCSIYSMVLVRDGGRSRFTNVSNELLQVCADFDADGAVESAPLFSDPLGPDASLEWFWDYANDGLKLAQLRFYEGVGTRLNCR